MRFGWKEPSHPTQITHRRELDLENLPLEITSAERFFYGDYLILLEGAIEEFLSCLQMIRRYQVSRGQRDPIASFQAGIKRVESMRARLERQNLPVTADSALQDVWDAAGVRLVCPFVQNIDQTVSLIRQIPGVQILREKDYIRNPKPNGYRSYHMIGGRNFNFLRGQMVGISKFREKTTVFCPFARWPS